jgi:hypothetical protein
MASTTTHSLIDTRPVTAPSTPTIPSVTPRPAHRTAAWILAGTVTVAVVSVAAGFGYRAYESSRAPAAVVGSASASRSDAAESAHGSAAQVVTGTGQPVTVTAGSVGTSVTVVPPSDSSLLAHGTRGSLADASGRALGVTR